MGSDWFRYHVASARHFALLAHLAAMRAGLFNHEDANQRLPEIAEILATGLIRLEALKSSRKSAEFGESSLHFTPDQSGDAPPCLAEVCP